MWISGSIKQLDFRVGSGIEHITWVWSSLPIWISSWLPAWLFSWVLICLPIWARDVAVGLAAALVLE
jgi:hypothetical protein